MTEKTATTLPLGPLEYARITNKILQTARTRIDRFELDLLSILREELDLLACSLYSFNPFSQSLSLRGQSGLSYDGYQSFSLPITSTAGQAFSSPKIQVFSRLLERADYRDKSLIRKFSLTKMIVVPIQVSLDGEEATVCSLCLYPKPEAELAQTEESVHFVECLKSTIGYALQFSMDYTYHLLRHEIVSGALHVSSGTSFLHKMLQLLKEWNFEAGSVFLFDSRAICLRLGASTGLELKGVPRRNVFYRLTETNHKTVQSFIKQQDLVIDGRDAGSEPPKYREKLDRKFHSALVCPFFAPRDIRAPLKLSYDGCLGVLRLVNRQIIHDQSKIETAAFTWEDREVVRFLCDILGVVTFLYQQVAQKGNDFERVVHGLETSILTVLGALHNIGKFVDHQTLFPAALKYSVPNSIAFTESLHEQIRVFKMRDVEGLNSVQLRPVKLYGDVISKLRSFARNSATFHGVEKLRLDLDSFLAESAHFAERKVQEIPWVNSDPELLLSVFKNLVENAIKYCKENSTCAIKLDWRASQESVEITIRDAGIGVPPEDEEFIFNEAYQAENAMRRRTVGTGIGLFQCRLIMEKLKGNVEFKREQNHPEGLVTNFVVRIPRERQ